MCKHAIIEKSDVLEFVFAANQNIYYFPKNSYLQGKRITGLVIRAQGSNTAKSSTGNTLVGIAAIEKGYINLKQGTEDIAKFPAKTILDENIDTPFAMCDFDCVDFERSHVSFPSGIVGAGATAGEAFELVVFYKDR